MKLTGTNRLWVADITHVRLKREFVYLAVVLDRFSRRVVGWALDRNLTSRVSLAALRAALEYRKPAPGLVHHSDRGPQYIHAGYLRMLRKHGMVPSLSRPGNPGDNANCESFFRTLKPEEVEAKEYADLEDLRLNIAQFVDRYYNEERLHSALGYRSPAEFERVTGSPVAADISSGVELGEADPKVESRCELQKLNSSCHVENSLNEGFTVRNLTTRSFQD
jgi:transposase InsO family protein